MFLKKKNLRIENETQNIRYVENTTKEQKKIRINSIKELNSQITTQKSKKKKTKKKTKMKMTNEILKVKPQ